MVAPILEAGESKRKVYFPEGSVWQHMIVEGLKIDASAKSQLKVIEAPIGTPAVFVKQESKMGNFKL